MKTKTKNITPTRILFIGNSFTARNDLPLLIEQVAASASAPIAIETQRITVNGASLRLHWNKGEAQALIRQGGWDYVVLQEQSTLPIKTRCASTKTSVCSTGKSGRAARKPCCT